MTRSPYLTLIVGIATAGRRTHLTRALICLAKQSVLPSKVIICPAVPEDFDQSTQFDYKFPIEVVSGGRGLTKQRNAIIRAAGNADLIFFIDDDFYPATSYIYHVHKLFERYADIAVATNQPDLDGAGGSEIEHDDAVARLDEIESTPSYKDRSGADVIEKLISITRGGYGCNMTVRISIMRSADIWFDEKLPLYGWLEDMDMSRRVSAYGRIVQYDALQGIHLGSKNGRTSGVRFGYSQIANPIYLVRKGSLESKFARRHIARNLLSNTVRFFWSEPWIDRRGRLWGNFVALSDAARGKLDPMRVVDFR